MSKTLNPDIHKTTPRKVAAEAPICSKCKTAVMVRVGREGLLENRVYPKAGLFPWECPVCRIRTLVKSRGKRKPKKRSDAVAD